MTQLNWIPPSLPRYALILAGGRGSRMGANVPKQFLPLQIANSQDSSEPPQSILSHTLRRFLPLVQHIILVLPTDEMSRKEALLTPDEWLAHSIYVVAGGATRFISVQAGLALLPDNALVAIHDGVRPFVSAKTIEQSFEAALQYGAAIPTIPLTDSIRRLTPDGASQAVPRSEYVSVQTPQSFRSDLIKQAYTLPYSEDFTDDASVFEAYFSQPVVLVKGNMENIKITSPVDLLDSHPF